MKQRVNSEPTSPPLDASGQMPHLVADIVNSVDGIVWEADAQTFQFTFVSKQAERILGHPVSRWLTEPDFWSNHIHPDDREWTVQFCQKATARMESHKFEYRMLADDGRVVWLKDIVTVVATAGHAVKLRGIMTDITERKQTEAALMRSEELFRAIIEDQTEMIVRWKPDGTRTFVNQAYCRVFGKSYDELVGTSFYPLVAEPYREAIRQKVLSLTPENPLATEIHESLSPTGERLWQEWTDRGLFDATGQLVELQSTGRDITDRKRAEIRIEHLNRVYAVLSDINQTIVREKEPQAMLLASCQIAVAKGGFCLAWIGMEDEITHRLKLAAHAGAAPDTVKLLQAMLETEHAENGCAITQQAWKSGQPGICNDLEQSPEMSRWREAARQRHYRAMASLPLKLGGKVTGIFNLYAAEVDFFTEEEIRLLGKLALDISFGLEIRARETQQRQAEEALRNVLLHARTIVMHTRVTAPEGWQPTDPKWNVATFGWKARVNDELAAQEVLPLEIPAGGDYATAWGSAKHRDDLEPMALVATTALASGATNWHQEFRCLDRCGRLHWFNQIASVENVAHGLWRVTTINTDITGRKQAEEELRWKTALFEAQMDSTLDALLVVNSEGRKIIQNRRMSEVWKIPQAIAENPDDAEQVRFVTNRTKDPKQFAEKVAYLYAHPDEISRDEIELVDGTVLDRYSAPVKDKTGNYYGRIWTFRDITERRKLEEQFRQSQKMDAIGQLSGGVAHDFNNILCVILGHTSLLEMGELTPEEQTSALQQIAQAAERAANLTRQLLAFSRRQIMQARPLDLNETTTSMIKMLQRLIGEHIVLQTRYAPEAALVQADPGMIEQVLLNLVVNARDAMPNGGEIFIQTEFIHVNAAAATGHRVGKTGDFIRLSVRDTGCGIAPEHLPRIFEPFFTTKEVGKGTGLGLATVFGIVEQHQGWIEAESEPGRGATFHVYLPKLKKAAPSVSLPAPARVRGGSETILMVEDERALRALTRNALERYGYRVLEAASGPAALDLWSQNAGKIQLLLTDLVMPEGVSGRELAAKLQAEQPELKVIYMSGYPGDVAGQGLSLREDRNFLQKPFSPIKLAELVRAVLDAS